MASLVDFGNVEIVSPEPPSSADAGVALNENFRKISTHIDTTDDPSSADDRSVGFRIGSRWVNSSTKAEFLCIDDTVPTWLQLLPSEATFENVTVTDGASGILKLVTDSDSYRVIFGDANNLVRCAVAKNMQLVTWSGIDLIGNIQGVTGAIRLTSDSSVNIPIPSASSIGLAITAAASQTVNLQEWRTSSGAVASSVRSDGTFVLRSLASAPTSPVAGQVYFNTTDNHFYGHNGSTWKQLDN